MVKFDGFKLFLYCFCFAQLRMVAVKGQDASDQEICLPLRNNPTLGNPQVRQGVPGKMGPRGLQGLTGPRGIPGVAGRCACEPSEVKQLNNTIQTLTAALRRGFLKLDDGWITPLDGFQYKLVTTTQSWQRSRNACQRMGGDLATLGVQNRVTRRIIFDALRAGRSLYYWIGLGDYGHEGSFRWVNGRSSSTRETALWADGQPDGTPKNEDCCLIYSSDLFTHDYPCSRAYRALCQKPI